jgi:hypothetical protein
VCGRWIGSCNDHGIEQERSVCTRAPPVPTAGWRCGSAATPIGRLAGIGAREIAAGVDLAAYRIVQEALTNMRKHGRATRAEIALRYTPSALEVEIIDSGTTTGVHANRGHGLGMRERVALYQGTLDVGAHNNGGFAVRAVLPT